jgi:hypothetical protein
MNLFGDSDYLEKLSLKGDPLERLEKAMISCKKCTKSLLIFKKRYTRYKKQRTE